MINKASRNHSIDVMEYKRVKWMEDTEFAVEIDPVVETTKIFVR